MSQPKISKIRKSECPEYEIVPDTNEQLPDSSVVLNLSDLAANYSQCVPFRFQVVNGFMAENVKDPTISVDEVYSVHLVKEIKVVVVKLDVSEFKVPVNSALRFGLVHDNAATVYETVEEILSAKNPPKVVCVMTRYVEDKFSLRKNEILLVKDVVKGKLGRSKTTLRVFSMSSYTELMLPKDCSALFSTDPQLTRLYLTDLLKYAATDFMPCQARIYPVEGSSSLLTNLLATSVITMDSEETHRSVVVSLFRDNPTSKQRKETSFIDIPTTIDIRVSVINTDKSDEEQIYEESQNLLTDYNPSKIQACVDASTDDGYTTQAQLLAEIRKERAEKEMADSAPPQYQKLLASKIESKGEYQELVTSNKQPEPSYSPVIIRKEKPISNPTPQKPAASDRDLLASYDSTPPSPVPRPCFDKSKPSQSPKVPPKPPKSPHHPAVAAAAPKIQGDGSRVLEQPSQLAQSPTTEEKSRDSTMAAELKKKPIKPPPPLPAPKKHASHNYEDLDGEWREPTTTAAVKLETKPTPAPRKQPTTSTWSSPVQKKGSMNEVPSSKTGSGDIESSLDSHGKDAASNPLSSETSHSRMNVPGDSDHSLSSYVKLYKSTGHSADGDVVAQKLTGIEKKLSEVLIQISEIQARQALFEEELFALKAASSPRVDGSQNVSLNVVAGMSPTEVQAVLSAAGLSQYRESFAREAVDGEMFMILDEEILSGELGVTSRLHQLRILKMKENNT